MNYFSNYLALFLISGGAMTTLLCLIALGISLHQNKFRLLNGALCNIAILVGSGTLVLAVIQTNSTRLIFVLFALLAIIFIPILFLYIFQGILLLWNGFIVWQKESHTLGNMLTLALGVIIVVAFPLLRGIFNDLFSHYTVAIYDTFIFPVIAYLVFWFFAFITSFLLSRLYRLHYNQEYIIVLGAGLLNGTQVSPLLASRIQRALDFADAQKKKHGNYPLLVFSGDKGGDEEIPEGAAMKQYALTHGAPANKCLAEERSKNTYENMLFSKQIIETHHVDLNKGLFSTSDYHTFRAAGYAHKVGLNIDGLGAKTSKLFIPNAFIREFLALMVSHKRAHIIALCLILLLSILLFLSANHIWWFH